MQYSNPRMKVIVPDWPYGRDMTTTATFTIEVHPTRGERAARTTVDPTTGRISAPHRLTYAHSACLVDGDDGKLYILEDTGTHYSIMKSTMAHQHETVFPQDGPQYADLTFLFNELDRQRATTEEENIMPAEQTDQPTETVKIVSKKVRVRKMAAAVPANGGESKMAMREAQDAEVRALTSDRMAVLSNVPAQATEAELDAIFGADADVIPQEAPAAVVEPETQVPTDDLPEPTDTIREMTTDTDNREAYRAELASRDDEDDMRPVATWTSAPRDYDGFGTVTVQDNVAVYCGKSIRKVETPIRHLTWQRSRYGSGLHTAVGATEWKAIQASPGYARENGQNLLAIVDTQPLAQALETLKGQEADSAPVPPVLSVTGDKQVAYLLALAAQGAEALAAALRSGAVIVRQPGKPTVGVARTGKPNRVRKDGSTGKKMDAAKVAEFRARRAAGEDLKALGAAFNISWTMVQRIDKRMVWKDVA